MELKKTWFEIQTNLSDLENVLKFIDQLPSNIRQIFDPKTSNFIQIFIENDGEFGITNKIFNNSFVEAEDELKISYLVFQRNLKLEVLLSEKRTENKKAAETLLQIGFTQNSLILKASLLNKLWTKILNMVDKSANKIIDFADNQMVKLVRVFLEYLNSILGSLQLLIPSIDSIKEFKEVVENYLAVADELGTI